MSSKLVIKKIDTMPCIKNIPHGPSPDPTPAPPQAHCSDSEPDYGDPDETALLTSIPTSTITLKCPPPQKKPHTAAVVVAAVIADELKEEKCKDPICSSDSVLKLVQVPSVLNWQIGKIFLTTKPVKSLDEMPDRSSLIVMS